MPQGRPWRRAGAASAVTVDPQLEVITHAQSSTVAVLCRQPTFLMQLRHAGLDIVEARDVDHLATLAKDAVLVVIDLTRADGRRGLVARISTTVDPRLPLVLISADTVDLAILGAGREVHVVVPPLRAEDVVSCVERVLLEHRTARLDELLPARPSDPTASSVASPSPPQAVTSPRARPLIAPAQPSSPPPPPPWPVLAQVLLDQVAGLPSVRAVAQRLAEEVAEECTSDVAVLVHEPGEGWIVVGGVGLRSLEWGQQVEEDHWLVRVGRDRGPGLHVPDTDAVRADLVGAPLASRRHMSRLVSRGGDFMVCIGWSDPLPPGDRVVLLAAAAARHEPSLLDALQLRSVTQQLCRIVEPADVDPA